MIPFHDRYLKCATLTVALISALYIAPPVNGQKRRAIGGKKKKKFRRFAGNDSEK